MKKILIVDDIAFMRVMLRSILEIAGFQVTSEASNGTETVNMYMRYRPDLVIMDISMPEIDGVQATVMIKSLDPDAKIIMCSAMGQTDIGVQAIQSGATDFIEKPFTEGRVVTR